jgi:hypothetical protein
MLVCVTCPYFQALGYKDQALTKYGDLPELYATDLCPCLAAGGQLQNDCVNQEHLQQAFDLLVDGAGDAAAGEINLVHEILPIGNTSTHISDSEDDTLLNIPPPRSTKNKIKVAYPKAPGNASVRRSLRNPKPKRM